MDEKENILARCKCTSEVERKRELPPDVLTKKSVRQSVFCRLVHSSYKSTLEVCMRGVAGAWTVSLGGTVHVHAYR